MKPYATSKGIVIGSAWTPRPPEMSGDAVAIQRALLKGKSMKNDRPFAQVHEHALAWLKRENHACQSSSQCADNGAMGCACVQNSGMPGAVDPVAAPLTFWQRVKRVLGGWL